MPKMHLAVEPDKIVLTETATAVVSFDLPGRLVGRPSFAADFIERGTSIPLSDEVVRVDGANRVRYVARIPFTPKEPGRVVVGPVTVGLPVRGDVFSFFEHREQRFRTGAVPLYVYAPPEKDAPANYVGAISSNLVLTAALDAHVCTAGDPLVLSVEVSGVTDVARVRAPEFASRFRGTPFKLDAASLKTETRENGKRFTWRVRALEAGTVEFPSLAVSYFDVPSRAFREVRTEAIPVQIKAGAQVALGSGDAGDAEDDAMPMPDGIDLDFQFLDQDGGFTLQRAFAKATSAARDEDFAAAADAYRDYLDQLDRRVSGGMGFWRQVVMRRDAETFGRHYANLGALETLANRPVAAVRAFSRAEWFTGSTPSTTRGLRAAHARLKNDPRADLPPARMVAAFWFKWAFPGRVASLLGALLAVALFFWLALKAGRRLAGFAAVASAALAASAAGTVRLDPAAVAVGQPAAFVFTFLAGQGEAVESLQFGGLPEQGDGVEYGSFQTLTNNAFRLPVRFLKPYSGTLNVFAQGMKTTRRGGANSFFSSSHNFAERFPPLRVDVRPLPAEGRPADFSGAVGTRFRLVQRVDPERVHPGDLVTITYRLNFDGYFPTNAAPRLSGASDALKLYEIKETARTRTSVTWTQMAVPQTPAAVLAPAAELDWYDLAAKRYAVASARARRLQFVSATAASTQNDVVVVDGTQDASPSAADGGRAVVLRFAPSEASPVVATLPAETPLEELHRTDRGWRRVSAPSACGWTKIERQSGER
ncbi:MAG: hypothetical protein MJ138_05160 [Kiritimatiellae bacterium]|nr:hypothetical protein [Kiritimatiellia bacterium]